MSTVTVLMPVYNAMPFLPAALKSILEQTSGDLSIIAVDDGSTDGSSLYLAEVADPRLRVVRLRHLGLGAALNTGLDLCTSEYLARMDADDLSGPMRLSRQLGYLSRNPEVIAVGTNFRYIGSKGFTAPSPRLPLNHDSIRRGLLDRRLTLVHATMMFRTGALRAIGGYRIKGGGEDWDMFLRLTEAGQLANLAEVHYFWRLHQGNTSLARLIDNMVGIEYGCHCARLRAAGMSEPSFSQYREKAIGSSGRRLARLADAFAFAQYRRALAQIADGRPIGGYTRLAFSALCSPRRTRNQAVRIGRDLIARVAPTSRTDMERHQE